MAKKKKRKLHVYMELDPLKLPEGPTQISAIDFNLL
jgi:hypothetical protein